MPVLASTGAPGEVTAAQRGVTSRWEGIRARTRRDTSTAQAFRLSRGPCRLFIVIMGGRSGTRSLVLRHERHRLLREGRPDLAQQVVHVAAVEGDGAGYDIRSYDSAGAPSFIEVKTTRGPATAASFVTPNAVAFSRAHSVEYMLMRIFGYDEASNSGCYHVVKGALDVTFDLLPTAFRASLAG